MLGRPEVGEPSMEDRAEYVEWDKRNGQRQWIIKYLQDKYPEYNMTLGGQISVDIVKKGIALTPEGRKVFPDQTVKENLLLGAYLRKDKKAIKEDLEMVYDLFPRLLEREWQIAATLSGGEQQMLAVGRSLMSRPQLLMMDEPSLGLAPIIVKSIFEIIKRINKNGVSVLLIEQNAKAALEISDYAYVLETGTVVLEGPGKDLISNDQVKKAYLGA